jgi:serine/threonine-protein kinase
MHIALGLAYAGLGHRPRAVEAARRAMALAPATTNALAATAVMGDAAEILVRVGDVDGALALLERLLGMPAGRETSVALLGVDPIWDPLRRDERFAPMLARFAPR